ncbi:hypothetical protein ACHAWF_018449 [Thalassiosira exigua]
MILEHTESLLASLGPLRLVGHDVELDGLGQGTALPDGHDVALLHSEAGAAVSVDVLVTLLETAVLLDVVEVVPPHDDGALHLGGGDESLEDFPADGDVAGEGALLVHVGAFDGRVGGLDAEADVLDPAHGLHLLSVDIALARDENGILGLVGLFVLYRAPPPHDNGAHDVISHHCEKGVLDLNDPQIESRYLQTRHLRLDCTSTINLSQSIRVPAPSNTQLLQLATKKHQKQGRELTIALLVVLG